MPAMTEIGVGHRRGKIKHIHYLAATHLPTLLRGAVPATSFATRCGTTSNPPALKTPPVPCLAARRGVYSARHE